MRFRALSLRTVRQPAAFADWSPPGLRRSCGCLPEERAAGSTPHRASKHASPPRRSIMSSAVSGATAEAGTTPAGPGGCGAGGSMRPIGHGFRSVMCSVGCGLRSAGMREAAVASPRTPHPSTRPTGGDNWAHARTRFGSVSCLRTSHRSGSQVTTTALSRSIAWRRARTAGSSTGRYQRPAPTGPSPLLGRARALALSTACAAACPSRAFVLPRRRRVALPGRRFERPIPRRSEPSPR
jgi:hypothetical protein